MNLLSKLNSSAKTKTIEPREIFMTLPSKAPGYGYPRDVQSEVWKKWFDIRNEKNVILKMNTGSGKTVVGLIMLQSCLNEEKGPAIYVVPDNYLVKQVIDEAKRLGISATVDKDDYNYSNSKAILVTSIQTIVNGHSYFGMREAGNYPIGSIIIDDVHACMDKIIDQFMIKIDAETDAYKELIALFNSSLKDYNPKNYIDVVEMKDCRNNILVKYSTEAKVDEKIVAQRKAFEKENYVYPNECTPIIVHPSKFVDVVASPDENMRVMTEEELTCFRKNIRDFYSALCHNGSISDISKINELLSIYKLRKDDIVNRYTVKFERQK